jgi:hypothetical protein
MALLFLTLNLLLSRLSQSITYAVKLRAVERLTLGNDTKTAGKQPQNSTRKTCLFWIPYESPDTPCKQRNTGKTLMENRPDPPSGYGEEPALQGHQARDGTPDRVPAATEGRAGKVRRSDTQGNAMPIPCVWGKSRCRLHGGCSTGPTTAEGRQAIAESNRRRAKESPSLLNA